MTKKKKKNWITVAKRKGRQIYNSRTINFVFSSLFYENFRHGSNSSPLPMHEWNIVQMKAWQMKLSQNLHLACSMIDVHEYDWNHWTQVYLAHILSQEFVHNWDLFVKSSHLDSCLKCSSSEDGSLVQF